MVETDVLNGRSETDDLFRSGIPVDLGGTTYRLRPLSMDDTDKWEGQIKDVIASLFGKLAKAAGGVDGILALYRQTVDAQLDALYAYDELGSDPRKLPDRTALRAVASRDDVDVAIRKLVKHEFPLLKGMDFIGTWVPTEVRAIITEQLIRLLPEPAPPTPVESPPPQSMNDSSTNTPTTARQRKSGRR